MKALKFLLLALVGLVVIYGIRQEFRAISTIARPIKAGAADDTPDQPPTPLRLLARDGYFSPGLLADAEAALGIRIELTLYSSDHECRDRLDSDATWDLLLVPDYQARMLDRQNRSYDIDYEHIPNHDNLERSLPTQREMGDLLRCAVPLFFTTIGLGYDLDYVGTIPQSWEALFRPANAPLLRGNLGLLNSARRGLGVALIALGKSPNSRDPADVKLAADHVRQCMLALDADMERTGRATHGGSDYLAERLAGRKLFLTMVSSAAFSRVMERGRSLRFASPSEGSLVCIDSLVIPRYTRDRPKAEDLINYLLDPFVSARLTNESGCATTNEAATAYVEAHLYRGPAYALPMGRQFFYLQDIGDDEKLYLDAWQEITALHQARIAPVLDREVGFKGTFIESNDFNKP